MVVTVPFDLHRLLRAPEAAEREAAWEKLIAAHTRLLLSVARSLGGDRDDAMERYSFVLEKLRERDFHRLRTYNPQSGASFSTWLTVAARNLCLDHHRARYGRNRSACEERNTALRLVRRALLETDQFAVDADTVADHVSGPDDDLVTRNRDECLRRELAKLTDREQLILSLKFEDELSASRIARIVGYSTPFQVYRILASLQARLKAALKSQGIDDVRG